MFENGRPGQTRPLTPAGAADVQVAADTDQISRSRIRTSVS